MWLFALNMTFTHCEVYWGLDVEPSENQWRAANGIWGVRHLTWRLSLVLDLDNWSMRAKTRNTSDGQPVVWDCLETPSHPKSQTGAVQASLPQFPDGKWEHLVSHGPRVCAFGRGWIWRLCLRDLVSVSFVGWRYLKIGKLHLFSLVPKCFQSSLLIPRSLHQFLRRFEASELHLSHRQNTQWRNTYVADNYVR